MTNHYYIYLGRENGKRVIHKVGQTRQTCYARCKNADYKIGCAFDIHFDDKCSEHIKRTVLNTIERNIILAFKKQYKIEHGREYFRTPKKNWEIIKPFFMEEMQQIIKPWIGVIVIDYKIYEGWVTPNSY